MKDLVESVLKVVVSYKDRDSLIKISEVASDLKPNSKVLILGAGHGAEAIVIRKNCLSAQITAVDLWEDEIYTSRFTGEIEAWENNFSFFKSNCKLFNVEIDCVEKIDIFETHYLDSLHDDWDLVYYDCLDNGSGNVYFLVRQMLDKLWDKIKLGGTLMGDDFYVKEPDFKMTPIVESLFYDKNNAVELDFDSRGRSTHWMVKKHG